MFFHRTLVVTGSIAPSNLFGVHSAPPRALVNAFKKSLNSTFPRPCSSHSAQNRSNTARRADSTPSSTASSNSNARAIVSRRVGASTLPNPLRIKFLNNRPGFSPARGRSASHRYVAFCASKFRSTRALFTALRRRSRVVVVSPESVTTAFPHPSARLPPPASDDAPRDITTPTPRISSRAHLDAHAPIARAALSRSRSRARARPAASGTYTRGCPYPPRPARCDSTWRILTSRDRRLSPSLAASPRVCRPRSVDRETALKGLFRRSRLVNRRLARASRAVGSPRATATATAGRLVGAALARGFVRRALDRGGRSVRCVATRRRAANSSARRRFTRAVIRAGRGDLTESARGRNPARRMTNAGTRARSDYR